VKAEVLLPLVATWRASRSRGSCCLSPKARIPLPEGSFEFVVEDFGAGLEQEVSAA
jgi:hypothetical protein